MRFITETKFLIHTSSDKLKNQGVYIIEEITYFDIDIH